MLNVPNFGAPEAYWVYFYYSDLYYTRHFLYFEFNITYTMEWEFSITYMDHR